MPTNLTAEANHKWGQVIATKDPKKKLELLQEFYSLIPKHKGTGKLCVQVKKKMAFLRKEIMEKKSGGKKSGSKYFIPKEGAAQLVVIGPTNVGKSSLLHAVTNATVKISATPYTTLRPTPGMFNYEDMQFQIIEAPALMEGASKGKAWGLQILALARNSDCLILMVDASTNPIKQFTLVHNELENGKIILGIAKSQVEIIETSRGAGLRIILNGTLVDCLIKDIELLFRNHGILDANIQIRGNAFLEEIQDAIYESTKYLPGVIIVNKIDKKTSSDAIKHLKENINKSLRVVPISCVTRQGIDKLGKAIFETLKIIRIYTKEPRMKEVSEKPFILKKGSTVDLLARNIHSQFSKQFAFAMVWAKRLKYSPRKVGSNFVLKDQDIVELHVK